MAVAPEVTTAFDRRQTGVLLYDLEETHGGRAYRVNLRLGDELPPAAHVTAAHCLAFDGDRMVLALHVERQWTIPGGRLEPGETALECVVREAREEAGIEVGELRLVAHQRIESLEATPVDWPFPFPGYQVFYVARLLSMGEITATDECTEARLFAPDEVRVAPGWAQQHPSFYEALLELRP